MWYPSYLEFILQQQAMQLQVLPLQVLALKIVVHLSNPASKSQALQLQATQLQALSLMQSLQDSCIAYKRFYKYKQQKHKQLSACSAISAAIMSFEANNVSIFDIFNSIPILQQALKARERKSCTIKGCVQGQYLYLNLTNSFIQN